MKQQAKKILSILFALVIMVSSVGTIAYADEPSSSTSSSTITKEEAQALLEAQKQELEKKIKENQAKLDKYAASQKATAGYIDGLDEKIGYLNEELTILDSEVTAARQEIEALEKEIAELSGEIEKVQASYDVAAAQLEKLEESFRTTQNAYCLRLRAMYVSGSNSIIVALLTSKDIAQLFSRYEMIKAISKSDSALLKEVNKKIDEILEKNSEILSQKTLLENAKKQLDEKDAILVSQRNAVEAKQEVIAEKKVDLAMQRAESDALLAEYTAKTAMYGEYKYEDEELIAKVDGEINALLNGLKNPSEVTTAVSSGTSHSSSTTTNESSLYFNSNAVLNMTYPVPNYYSVSESFGFYKSGGRHTGIDYPLMQGVNVVAAQKGIVITTKELNYSYGKYVMIYHGTDAKGRKIVTLYAHNSKLLVSTGQTVTKGQPIAYGGSTGNSTGPHCHFEVIIDGEKVNPAYYLTK